jgi:nicotinamide riboside kinase
LKKIVIIGPESTGKSTLCQQLAAYYHTLWVPEFAREYLLALRKQYTFEDLLIIAKGQLVLEDNFIKGMNDPSGSCGQLAMSNMQKKGASHSPLTSHYSHLFIDTNMYVMKVWCEFVFDKCHRWILEQIIEREYDFYMLCNTDLTWTSDELREYPDLHSRKILYKMYLDILINQTIPWVIISGSDEQRFNQAIKVLADI